MTITLSLAEVDALTMRALTACNTRDDNARSVTDSVVASEADGIHSHGLARLPTYCEHARCGKIDGQATPRCERSGPAALKVDVCDGFAHPAIELGFVELVPLAKETGVAAMAVTNSYNCGVVGYHVERLESSGLVAFGYVNAPASIAPWGGAKPVFGTNPIAFAAPRGAGPPLVIDQSSSVVARSEVSVHAQTGEPIPEGWALDSDGQPTTDPKAALGGSMVPLGGSMVPLGGYKGAGLALIMEVMAAAMTGANFAYQASSFADNEGGPPRTGQFFIALDPGRFAGPGFGARLDELLAQMTAEPGTRVPGARRVAARARARRRRHDKKNVA